MMKTVKQQYDNGCGNQIKTCLRWLLNLGASASLLVVSACAPVQPWERGNLAKPQMALDPHPLQSALRAHNYGSREAAAGGNAAQGGGCGCY